MNTFLFYRIRGVLFLVRQNWLNGVRVWWVNWKDPWGPALLECLVAPPWDNAALGVPSVACSSFVSQFHFCRQNRNQGDRFRTVSILSTELERGQLFRFIGPSNKAWQILVTSSSLLLLPRNEFTQDLCRYTASVNTDKRDIFVPPYRVAIFAF